MPTDILKVQSFFKEARDLRSYFENRFGTPLENRPERYVWDYWNVPKQYTLLRTPAYHFFPSKLYQRFHDRLVWWGREVLGCHDVSPPQLSCYVEGCEQRVHEDLPHGPWAFVYSLTPWKTREFLGGETFLKRKKTERIPALFNQLLVFDPQIPHGVEKVRGADNVCDGRLVIHGWFVQPRPFVQGPLKTTELSAFIEALCDHISRFFSRSNPVKGVVSYHLEVKKDGTVARVLELTQNLKSKSPREILMLTQAIRQFCAQAQFSKYKSDSRITLPLMFD